MIPKKIHYIWIGGNNKPKNFGEVFDSWKKFANNFEIIEWNDDSISEFDLPKYYHKAYKEKRWAFASDVLRLYILEKYGGIYLDIDEILLKPIPEDFLTNRFFTALYHEVKDYYGFQYLGTEPNHIVLKNLIKQYESIKDYTIINKILSEEINKLGDLEKLGIKIYPQEYFYPLPGDGLTHSYGVHLANTSWVPAWKKFIHKIPFYLFIKNKIFKILPKKIKEKVSRIKY